MRDPFTVEKFVDRPVFNRNNWLATIDVPKASIADARRWLKAQGYQWTTTSAWRIVDREGKTVKTFFPRSF